VDTRAARWLLLVVGLLSTGLMLIPLLNTTGNAQDLSHYLSMAATGVAMLLPVVAILTLTTEWTQRTVLATFTAEPRRARVLGAKIGAGIILAAAGAVLAYALAAAALAISATAGRTVSWTMHPAAIAGVAVFLLLNIAMAMGFAALIQNTPAAIVAYFAVPVVIAAIGLAMKSLRDWVDSSTTFNWVLEGNWSGHTAQILTTTALWVALPLAAGAVRTIRREVK